MAAPCPHGYVTSTRAGKKRVRCMTAKEQRHVRAKLAAARRKHGLGSARLVDSIRPGCKVTILTPQNQQRSGRAVMRGPAGWVLNMGGRHGTPGIASDSNTVRVSCRKR